MANKNARPKNVLAFLKKNSKLSFIINKMKQKILRREIKFVILQKIFNSN